MPGPDGTMPLRRFVHLAFGFPFEMSDLFIEQGGVSVNGSPERDRDRGVAEGDLVSTAGFRAKAAFPVRFRRGALKRAGMA